MHRLYCPSQNISDNEIIIDNKDQVHHAKNVLRLKVYEEVVIFDDKGNEYCSINASLQSQRDTLPILEPIKNIKELLSDSGSFDLKLIPALTGERKPLKEILEESKSKNILVIIGPEGDFTSSELDSAKKVGCIPVSLGDLVLRVETAAVAVVSFIRFYLNSTAYLPAGRQGWTESLYEES